MVFVRIEPVNMHTKFIVRSFCPFLDNVGHPRIWVVPRRYAETPLFQQFYWAFVLMDPVNVLAKLEVRRLTRS